MTRHRAFLPLLSTLLILGVCAAIQSLLFTPYYQVNDDIFKVFYAQGVGSESTPTDFVGYSNPLWGLFLKTLFTAFPDIPWYGILLISIQYLSLAAILYALRLGEHSRFKTFLFIVAFFCVFHILLNDIQFTIASSLAAQAGFILCVALWQNRESGSRTAGWWTAGFLFFISSLIRFDGILITLFCAIPYLAYSWLKETKSARKLFWNRRKTFIAAVFVLVAGGAVYNFLWYQKDPAWREFNRFDRERVELQDYRINPYNEKTAPHYGKAGWTQNDYVMFKSWYFMDEDIYSVETMRKLKKNFPRVGAEGKPSSYPSLSALLSSMWAQVFLMYFLAFALFAPPAGLRMLLLQISWVLIFLTLMIYFLRAPDRVFMPLFAWAIEVSIFLAVSPLPILKQMKLRGGRWVSWAGTIFLGICLILGARLYQNYHTFNQVKAQNEKLLLADLQRLDPKDDELYVVWDSSFPYESINALDNFQLFRKFHLLVLAVYQRSPLAKKTMERFGLQNLLPDMVDNSRVFLICTPQEGATYRVYMREKHRMEIYPEKVFHSAFFKVFRVHSGLPKNLEKKKQ